MSKLWTCRRTFLGLAGILCLTFIGYTKGIDVSIAIAGIVTSVAASNSYQASKTTKGEV